MPDVVLPGPRRARGPPVGARAHAGRLRADRRRQRLARRLGRAGRAARRAGGARAAARLRRRLLGRAGGRARRRRLLHGLRRVVRPARAAARRRPGRRAAPPTSCSAPARRRRRVAARTRAPPTPCSRGSCAAAPGVPLRDLGPMRAARREPLLALGIARPPLRLAARDGAARGGGRLADRRGRASTYHPRAGRSKVTGTVRGTVARGARHGGGARRERRRCS